MNARRPADRRLARCFRHAALLALLATTLAAAPPQLPPMPPSLTPRGLVTHEAGVAPGYVLFSPIRSGTAYLVDNDGRVVHTWQSPYSGTGGYLLPNGNLLRSGRDPEALQFRHGGVSGILQEVDWDGKVLWEWRLSEQQRILHHDIEPLPNGNILALVWEVKSPEEARRAGRRPDRIPEQGLHPDWVIEIEPQRPNGARVVWEWHVWDHRIQDVDPKAPHYGVPSEHPGRLDINALAGAPTVTPEELAQLQALGYVPPEADVEDLAADFLHTNSIAYHATLDQIALSVPELGEVWILDHSTSSEQARGASGGRAGRGGDLLYRWGNPAAYERGTAAAQRLFYQHDARWIPEGLPGAGRIMVFNNGRERPAGPWSSVEVIEPPLGSDGRYALAPGEPFGPAEPAWSWRLPEDRFAPFISGAQPLPNGNTLVCSGPDGLLLEVTRGGRIVWEYRNPFSGDIRLADGSSPQPGVDQLPFAVFRAARIPPDHPALAGRTLEPLDPQPEPWPLRPASAAR